MVKMRICLENGFSLSRSYALGVRIPKGYTRRWGGCRCGYTSRASLGMWKKVLGSDRKSALEVASKADFRTSRKSAPRRVTQKLCRHCLDTPKTMLCCDSERATMQARRYSPNTEFWSYVVKWVSLAGIGRRTDNTTPPSVGGGLPVCFPPGSSRL